jgi:hypothetical protein
MKRLMLLFLAVMVLLSSCVSNTMVRFDTPADEARIYLDGVEIDENEAIELSNALWENPDLMIEADGYETYYGEVEKELKGTNLIFGLILWWPSLLYVWGPSAQQFIQLRESK